MRLLFATVPPWFGASVGDAHDRAGFSGEDREAVPLLKPCLPARAGGGSGQGPRVGMKGRGITRPARRRSRRKAGDTPSDREACGLARGNRRFPIPGRTRRGGQRKRWGRSACPESPPCGRRVSGGLDPLLRQGSSRIHLCKIRKVGTPIACKEVFSPHILLPRVSDPSITGQRSGQISGYIRVAASPNQMILCLYSPNKTGIRTGQKAG